MTVLIMMCVFFCPYHHFLRLSNNSVLITAFTQALCRRWPCLPIQCVARVGGLMEYGSNWPPIQQCSLQVSLSSEHTQMDAHILKLAFQFSRFALELSLDVLLVHLELRQSCSAIVHICNAWQHLISQISSSGLSYPHCKKMTLISHQQICFGKKNAFLFMLLFVGQMNLVSLQHFSSPRLSTIALLIPLWFYWKSNTTAT